MASLSQLNGMTESEAFQIRLGTKRPFINKLTQRRSSNHSVSSASGAQSIFDNNRPVGKSQSRGAAAPPMQTRFGELMIVKEKRENQGSGDQHRQKNRHHIAAKKTLKAKLAQNVSKRNDSIEGNNEERLARAAEHHAEKHLGRDKSAVFTRRHTQLDTNHSNQNSIQQTTKR